MKLPVALTFRSKSLLPFKVLAANGFSELYFTISLKLKLLVEMLANGEINLRFSHLQLESLWWLQHRCITQCDVLNGSNHDGLFTSI